MAKANPEQVKELQRAYGWTRERLYFISYDLHKDTGDYAGIEKALQDAGGWKLLGSGWILKSDLDEAEDVVKQFTKFVNITEDDATEKIFVCELKDNIAGWLAPGESKLLR